MYFETLIQKCCYNKKDHIAEKGTEMNLGNSMNINSSNAEVNFIYDRIP